MRSLLAHAHTTAKKKPLIIAFPEASDERIRKAVKRLAREKLAYPLLVGREEEAMPGIPLIRSDTMSARKAMRTAYQEIREAMGKTPTRGELREAAFDPVVHALILLHHGFVDAVITGIAHPTAHTLRWSFRIIPRQPGVKRASSFFIMEKHDAKRERVYLFADCAVQPLPSAEELAEIGMLTAQSARKLGLKPRVAFLSYSTHGSAQGDSPERVRRAARIAQRRLKTIPVDGEVQLDAALIPSVAKRKHAGKLGGRANVLVFPSLDAGNIGYKLVRLFGRYAAYGPFIQGLEKPVADLSRSATVDEVVETALFISLLAKRMHHSGRKKTNGM